MKIGELINKLIEIKNLHDDYIDCGYEDDCRGVTISEVSYDEKEGDVILK